MNTYIALAFAATALVSCETTGDPKSTVDIDKLPERAAHWECLRDKVNEYSRVQGSPLELGQIASSGCNRSRYALYDALVKAKGPYFAKGYIGASETEEPKMIAAAIIKKRGY